MFTDSITELLENHNRDRNSNDDIFISQTVVQKRPLKFSKSLKHNWIRQMPTFRGG